MTDGIPGETAAGAEWWRVVEISADSRGRLHFIDEGLAETFARYLLDQGAGLVIVEHWRAGERIASRRLEAPVSA